MSELHQNISASSAKHTTPAKLDNREAPTRQDLIQASHTNHTTATTTTTTATATTQRAVQFKHSSGSTGVFLSLHRCRMRRVEMITSIQEDEEKESKDRLMTSSPGLCQCVYCVYCHTFLFLFHFQPCEVAVERRSSRASGQRGFVDMQNKVHKAHAELTLCV